MKRMGQVLGGILLCSQVAWAGIDFDAAGRASQNIVEAPSLTVTDLGVGLGLAGVTAGLYQINVLLASGIAVPATITYGAWRTSQLRSLPDKLAVTEGLKTQCAEEQTQQVSPSILRVSRCE